MILSRVIDHVKKQHWTAVFLDFVIVVMGVYIGIQLGNWNEARVESIAAAKFHERLLADMRIEAVNYEYLEAYYRTVKEASETTYNALSGEMELSDAELLVNAFRASQYNWMERHRATYDELVASGNFDLIADTELRTRVAGYFGTTFLEEIAADNKNSEYRIAFRKLSPPALQTALSEQCGDRQIEGAAKGTFTLDYSCALDWPEDRIAAAAAALRSDDALIPLLRLRIANLDARNFAMASNYAAYDLDSFKRQETDE